MPGRPNVLFVFADQHRRQAMGCAGNPDVETPNFDRLAAEGVRLENACGTDPICTPSRGCLLTGQYPFEHGALINEVALDGTAPTVARAFAEAGYRTGYVGKWHLDGVPTGEPIPEPRRGGFEEWAASPRPHDYSAGHYPGGDPDEYAPAHETDRAIEFIEDGEAPFCLYLAWGPPHPPYDDVPERYREAYDPGELAVRPNVEPERTPTDQRTDQESAIRRATRDYYAQVTALDEQFGRLLAHLDSAGLAEDTIVVYTSDHGDHLWSHGQGFPKGSPWAESVGVPFIVRWPGELPAGRTRTTPVGTVDMAPTVLGLAGVSVPAAMTGTDRSCVLRGGDPDEPDSAYLLRTVMLDEQLEWRAVRTERYTYAELIDGTPWLLYDNVADPYQRTNLAFDPEHAGLRAELGADLAEHRERVDDPAVPGEQLARERGKLTEYHAARDYNGI